MGLYQDVHEDTSGNVFVNLNDSAGNGITSASGWLDVNIHTTTPISIGIADETAFTYGSSLFEPVGGVYNSAITNLSSGQSGAVALTTARAMQVSLYGATGNAVGDSNADGIWVKQGDGTNHQAFNASNEALVHDTSLLGEMTPANAALTQVSLSNASQTALALNAARKGFIMVNDSTKAAYVAFSATATTSAYTYKILPNSTIEPNFGSYTGVISVISLTGVSGKLVITELT